MIEHEYKWIKTIFQSSSPTLMYLIAVTLAEYYSTNKIHATKDYIYVEGDIPVMLIAHVDTVHPSPPDRFFYDREYEVIWSPDGLGADDRAGVFSLLEIVFAGYKPSLLFTMGEEIGGSGAVAAIMDYPKLPTSVNCLIELDRHGNNDAVYYNCGNSDFKNYISRFGFKETEGIFSDIMILGPNWDIASVNLSIGYYNEHSASEYLCYNEMYDIINKIKEILNNYPSTLFNHQETKEF